MTQQQAEKQPRQPIRVNDALDAVQYQPSQFSNDRSSIDLTAVICRYLAEFNIRIFFDLCKKIPPDCYDTSQSKFLVRRPPEELFSHAAACLEVAIIYPQTRFRSHETLPFTIEVVRGISRNKQTPNASTFALNFQNFKALSQTHSSPTFKKMNFIYAVIMVVTVMVSIKSVAAPLPAGQTFSIDDPATICATLSPVNGINVAKTCNDISVEQNNLDYTTYNGWSLYKSYTWFNYTSGTHQDGTTYPNGASWPVVASTGAVDFSKFLFKIETYPTSPPATTWRTTFNLGKKSNYSI